MNELILATVEHLRSAAGLSLSADVCDEQPDGQPPPNAGQVYYAVHEGAWTNTADESLDEYCGVCVTITLRAGYAPRDRIALALLRDLRARRAAVRAAIHDNYDLMNLANTKLGPAVNGFVEPLRFRDAGRPQTKGPDWFYAEAAGHPVAGVTVTLVFEKARRVQTLESMG
ncbi:hypothetical protein [Zavarzinella formosa]|uniref:hypothetical protein n=1 Tax=Zavarzinella formosa TaxID=360055 RepID=UPI0002F708B0|nr:hypothetical protein [Zavarzinella formosa]